MRFRRKRRTTLRTFDGQQAYLITGGQRPRHFQVLLDEKEPGR
jgi:hypothetical protein